MAARSRFHDMSEEFACRTRSKHVSQHLNNWTYRASTVPPTQDVISIKIVRSPRLDLRRSGSNAEPPWTPGSA